MAKLIVIKTSKGPAQLVVSGSTVKPKTKEDKKTLENFASPHLSSLSVSEGWFMIIFLDDCFGVAEYPYIELQDTDEEGVAWDIVDSEEEQKGTIIVADGVSFFVDEQSSFGLEAFLLENDREDWKNYHSARIVSGTLNLDYLSSGDLEVTRIIEENGQTFRKLQTLPYTEIKKNVSSDTVKFATPVKDPVTEKYGPVVENVNEEPWWKKGKYVHPPQSPVK